MPFAFNDTEDKKRNVPLHIIYLVQIVTEMSLYANNPAHTFDKYNLPKSDDTKFHSTKTSRCKSEIAVLNQ